MRSFVQKNPAYRKIGSKNNELNPNIELSKVLTVIQTELQLLVYKSSLQAYCENIFPEYNKNKIIITCCSFTNEGFVFAFRNAR